jgi:hypothetical protein
LQSLFITLLLGSAGSGAGVDPAPGLVLWAKRWRGDDRHEFFGVLGHQSEISDCDESANVATFVCWQTIQCSLCCR